MSSADATRPVAGASALVASALHDDEFARRPEPVWKQLRDHHPVFHDTIDDVYVLSRHDDVRWAFTEAAGLSNRVYARTVGKVFGPSMLQMDGRAHVQRRKVVAPQMLGARLALYADLIDVVARELVEDAVGRGSFDVVADVSSRLPGTVIATMLGLPREDLSRFFGWYEAMMAGLWTDAELRRRGHQAHLELQDHLAPIIARRLREPGSDLISRLLLAEVDGERMDGPGVGSFISLLLTAGGETTDKAIATMWWLLLTHPDEYAATHADPARLDAVFSETMRLYPPLIYLGREALHAIERHGVVIPAHSVVRLSVGAANRDERVFCEPDRFWTDRPDLRRSKELRSAPSEDGRASHLAFGAGPHFCLGYELARLETVAVSRHLLRCLGPTPIVHDVPDPLVRAPNRSASVITVAATPTSGSST